MSDSPPSDTAVRQDIRPLPEPNTRGRWRTRVLLLLTAVLPASLMAVLAAVTVLFVLAIDLADVSDRDTALTSALTVASGGALLILLLAVYGAGRVDRQVAGRVNDLRTWLTSSRANLRELSDRVRQGEHPQPSEPPSGSPRGSDPFTHLAHELSAAQHAAEKAVVDAAGLRYSRPSEQQVEVFVNVARRMQSLVHREITLLDELESQVEDPDLLKGLFTIDHLATRMRRQSESLAVLGGAASRRKWSKPVSLYEVLRSAVAEVEHYSRVKVVPPVTGTLNGSAVVDVIHLIAELIENATKFSPPSTQVMLRAESVPAGVAIDIEDRGLGMQTADIHRMNELLANPTQIDIGELLRDGRIGLYVVSALAGKHDVRIQLQRNVFGGTQAVVLLPNTLVGAEAQARDARPSGYAPAPTPAPAPAAPEPAPATATAFASAPRTPVVEPPVTHAPAVRAPLRAEQPQPFQPPHEADRPRLPTRVPHAQGGSPGHTEPAPAPPPAPVPTPPPVDQGQQPPGARPPLPERRAQTHLAPELRRDRAPGNRDTGGDHTPDLMSAFQSGFSRFQAENADHVLDHNDSNS